MRLLDRENPGAGNNRFAGICYAVAAYSTWGFLTLYWKILHHIPATELLAHRILWSFLFVLGLLFMVGRWDHFKTVAANRSKRNMVFWGALFISANWFVFIWAVNNNHIVEISLGYYINPLFSVFLGMAIFKERLNFWQLVSLFLAVIGVAILTIRYGRIPWISLSLAFLFGMYGMIKKMTGLDSLTALALETFFMLPPALGYLFYITVRGTGSFGTVSQGVTFLLVFSGILTALPLLWFAQAANRIPLSMVGFIQYLSPSITLLIGIFIYNELFTNTHLICFGLIWFALALYALSGTGFMQASQPAYYKKKVQEKGVYME